MFSDTLTGFAAAVALLVLVSLVLTSLLAYYQRLFEKHSKEKIHRPDLKPLVR